MEIEFYSRFLKKARRLSSKEKELLSEKVEWFRANPNDPKLKLHPLGGKLKGLLAFSLTHNKRVTLMFFGKRVALFVDVGPHDDVYK